MRYKHDCERCTYLGEFIDISGASDLYFCHQDIGGPTVIARYGNDGPDYRSGLHFQISPALRAATRRAIKKGITKKLWVVCDKNSTSWKDGSFSAYTSRSNALTALRKYNGGKVMRFDKFFK